MVNNMRQYKTCEEIAEILKADSCGIFKGMTAAEIWSELLERAAFDCEETTSAERFNNCKAWELDGRTFQSYNTAAAILFGKYVIEFGSHSSTTARQVTRWAEEWHGAKILRANDLKAYCAREGIALAGCFY